ncbi:MAG: hypothetical protein NZ957_03645 [Thaumarchaeota archaeon]|nr:hypothetical protein [Candidatus Calditenuaceae archaeon]MDW8042455.1 hypothetical protein [Nitrososphaerota archaeon]
MRTRLFRCTNCDLEVRLQAWKAVCPRCGKQYTLVPVQESLSAPSPKFAYASAALLTLAGLITAASSLPYWGLGLAFSILASIAVLTRSLGGHAVGAATGVALGTVFGALIATNFPILIAGLASSALSVYDELEVSEAKRRSLQVRSE